MKVNFERFRATDGIELQGWRSEAAGPIGVATETLHVHGFAGDGHSNKFLDSLHPAYSDAGSSFFSFDTRGSGVINWSNRNGEPITTGSCFEVFSDSIHDIRGAARAAEEHGAQQLIVQGHSLGASKVINYCLDRGESDALPIAGVVLISPTDMIRWTESDSKHAEHLERAHHLLDDGNPQALVDTQCWAYGTPMSAAAYVSLSERGGAIDVYSTRGSLATRLSQLAIRTLIICGSEDEAIKLTHGTIDKWRENMTSITPPESELHIIDGASHSFEGYERELARIIGEFATRVVQS